MANRVVHFELGTVDPERAARFYSEVFGWKVTKWDGPEPYWLCSTGEGNPGIDGGIMRHKDSQPRTINTIAVESIEQFVTKVNAAGGELCKEKFAIPGVGYQAYCKDTEGNIFGIHQFDPSAK